MREGRKEGENLRTDRLNKSRREGSRGSEGGKKGEFDGCKEKEGEKEAGEEREGGREPIHWWGRERENLYME